MRDISIMSGNSYKRSDTDLSVIIRLLQDNYTYVPDDVSRVNVKLRGKNTKTLFEDFKNLKLDDENNIVVSSDDTRELPADNYEVEVWVKKGDKTLIYPDTDELPTVSINKNIYDLPDNGSITNYTLDEFIDRFNKAIINGGSIDLTDYVKTDELKQQLAGLNIPKVSLDSSNRVLTINGSKIDIPDTVDLSKYATKDIVPKVIYNSTDHTLTIDGQQVELQQPIDLSDYYTKEQVNTKLSNLPTGKVDLSGYLTIDEANKTYVTKDDLKTVTSNANRHAPIGWTLDRTTNPWTIWFDNGCGLQFPNYGTSATVYGYGFSANVQNTNIDTWPLIGSIMSASHGTLTLDNISKITGSADYWGPDTKVINPIRTDAGDYDWSNVYFNNDSMAKKGQYQSDRQKVMLRVMYELGIWSIDDIKSFGLTKKEG